MVRFPVPVTVPHWFDFGEDREVVGPDLARAEAWDALRTATEGPFALPASATDLGAAAGRAPVLEARARTIDAWARSQRIETLASYGAGVALLEWWLGRLAPDRRLMITEHAPATVERLAKLLPAAEVSRHDLLTEEPVAAELHLFHRIDTEFDTAQWHSILARFASQRVLLVAAAVAGPRDALREALHRTRHRNATRAGWLRNRAAFEALWRPTHRATPLRVADLEGWSLEPHGRHDR